MKNRNLPKNQSGAVLIIAMLILLAMTVLGTSSMNTVTMEERMVSNIRDANVSFQAAESGLVDCQNYTGKKNPKLSAGGYYVEGEADEAKGGAFEHWWDDVSIWKDRSVEYGVGADAPSALSDIALVSGGVAEDPICIREHIGLAPDSLDFKDRFKAIGTEMYTVTAKGFGAEETTESIVQSTYFARYK